MANRKPLRDTLPSGFIAHSGAHISALISGKAWEITWRQGGIYDARCQDGRQFSGTLIGITARLLDYRADGK